MKVANKYGFQDLVILREIGRGGFGRVDEVEDLEGQRFARKTFAPNPEIPTDSNDQLRNRFKREITIQSRLDSRWVIPILHKSLSAAAPWFIMPLAAGTFDQRIAAMKSSGNADVEALTNILDALQFLHDLDYVHRDLNPKNILFHEEVWKLADFGTVLPPNGNTVVLTRVTAIFTESYCSPEQSQNFHSATTASDIYSLGCILHDIYGSGKRIPYGQCTAPGKVGLLISKCTERDPKKRPSIGVLRTLLLEAILADGHSIKPLDQTSQFWLSELESVDEWDSEKTEEFAHFLNSVDLEAKRLPGKTRWVSASDTPFLTRLPGKALQELAIQQNAVSQGVIEKYCDWVKKTEFEFDFADLICARLCTIFDHGSLTDKARAFIALIHLGETHNRWYVMRCTINRCRKGKLKNLEAERLALELGVEGYEWKLRRCLLSNGVDSDELSTAIAQAIADEM